MENKLEEIWQIVRDNPNDMELGRIIRNMYFDERDLSSNRQLNLFD